MTKYHCWPKDKDMTSEERLCTVLLEAPSRGLKEKYNAAVRKFAKP
jgi:hypothetical protein